MRRLSLDVVKFQGGQAFASATVWVACCCAITAWSSCLEEVDVAIEGYSSPPDVLCTPIWLLKPATSTLSLERCLLYSKTDMVWHVAAMYHK